MVVVRVKLVDSVKQCLAIEGNLLTIIIIIKNKKEDIALDPKNHRA